MQTELKAETAAALQAAVQGLTDDMIEEMKVSPLRQFEPTIVQDPLVYRLYEVGDGTHQAGVLWADQAAKVDHVHVGHKSCLLCLSW